MKLAKRFIAVAAVMALMSASAHVSAEEYCCSNGGCAYDDCCRSTSLAPAIALGTIAIIAIVAVACQNTSGHAHCHAHN